MSEDIYKRSYDLKCKEILSYKSIASKILKYCLDEYKDCNEEDIIPLLGVNTNEEKIMCIQNAFDSHEYDLFFSSRLPNSTNEIDLFIDLEPQKTSDVNYQLHNRGIFYIGNEIVYQYKRIFKRSEYDKLRKVISIFISFDAPSKKEENSFTVFHLSKNLKKGYNGVEEKDYDKIQIITIYLGQEDCDDPLLDFLRLIFRSDIKFEEKMECLKNKHNIPLSESLKQEVHEMYGISDLIEKRGIAIGIEQGIIQGIERGQFEALLSAIKNVMKNTNVDEKTAMKTVGIQEKDYFIYLEALKQNA